MGTDKLGLIVLGVALAYGFYKINKSKVVYQKDRTIVAGVRG